MPRVLMLHHAMVLANVQAEAFAKALGDLEAHAAAAGLTIESATRLHDVMDVTMIPIKQYQKEQRDRARGKGAHPAEVASRKWLRAQQQRGRR